MLFSVLVQLALVVRFLGLDVQCLAQRFTLAHTYPHRDANRTASSPRFELLSAQRQGPSALGTDAVHDGEHHSFAERLGLSILGKGF